MEDEQLLSVFESLVERFKHQVNPDTLGEVEITDMVYEIRRRIMEGHAAVVIEPEPEKIKIEIEEIELTSAKGVHPPAHTVFYNVSLFNSRVSCDERCTSQAEAKKFLRGVEAAASFGLAIEKAPDIFP